jgi:hypothetical protein
MPLDEKARLKLDKIFMAFGSQMHALERNAGGKDWIEYREDAWMWSVMKVSTLVDELWKDEKAGPQSPPSQQPQHSPPTQSTGETTVITVKSFAVQSQGQRKDGTPWTRYQVRDSHDLNYYTFHTSYQLGESYEIDWEWRGEGERKYRFIPDKARAVRAYKVGSDGNVTRQNTPAMADPDDEIPF